MRAARIAQALTVVLLALVVSAAGIAASHAGSGSPVFLRSLQMIDVVHGYALGGSSVDAGRLLRTTDGGRHWTDITPQGTGHNGAFGAAGWTVLFATALGAHTFSGHLSHQGPSLLRWALFEAAQCAARRSSPDHAYYLQVAKRIDHNRACLSVARKLCRRAHHILRELGDDALAPTGPPMRTRLVDAAA